MRRYRDLTAHSFSLSAVLSRPQPGQKFDLHADDYDRITPLHRGRRNLTCLIYVHTEPDETGQLRSAQRCNCGRWAECASSRCSRADSCSLSAHLLCCLPAQAAAPCSLCWTAGRTARRRCRARCSFSAISTRPIRSNSTTDASTMPRQPQKGPNMRSICILLNARACGGIEALAVGFADSPRLSFATSQSTATTLFTSSNSRAWRFKFECLPG